MDDNLVSSLIFLPGIEQMPLYTKDVCDVPQFDFEKILPVPEVFKSSPHGGIENPAFVWYMTYHGMNAVDENLSKTMSDMCFLLPDDLHTEKEKYDWWILELEVARDAIRDGVVTDPILYSSGKRSYNNFCKHNARDWYEWCVQYWGTPSDAIDTFIFNDMILFSTKDSAPEPVFAELAAQHPDLEMVTTWMPVTENGAYAYTKLWKGGKCIDQSKDWSAPITPAQIH